MKLYLKFIITIIFLFQIAAHAGSVFSASPSGIGLRRYTVSARGLGMGATGLASPDSITLTSYSVSKWREIDQTRVTISIQYAKFNTEISNSNFSSATGDIGDLNLAIPFTKHKFLLGLSLVPYSITDFRYTTTIQNSYDLIYEENIFNDGNITRAQAALIWSPIPKIGISASVNYYFGSITDEYILKYNDPNYFDSGYKIDYRIGGPGIGFSFDTTPVQKFMFAGFVDLKPTITLKREFTSPISNAEETLTESASFPVHFGLGASYQLFRRLLLTADYSQQNWSEGIGISASDTDDSNTITGKTNLDDWYNFGFGIERSAKLGRGVKFWNGVDLRAGLSTTSLGYKFNGNSVLQYAGHLGLGIPFSRWNRIDFAFAGGIRGTIKDNLAKETFISFEISISLGEQWFQKLR